MLPPYDLKNKSFTKAMRGYNPVEVDEYIEFLIEKYTELYRENDELERKLKTVVARLDEIKNDEDSIRSTMLDAKRAANKIKADAEARAESIVLSAKTSCNTILANFNSKIELGRDTLAELQRDAFELKKELFSRYSEHIKLIEKLTEGIDEDSIPPITELRQQVLDGIKADVLAKHSNEANSENHLENETPAEVTDEQFTMPNELFESATAVYDTVEEDTDISLKVEREPLVANEKLGFKGSVMELNRQYKESGDEIVNTPDSDIEEETSYLDFVKSVTGKDSEDEKKKADFEMLFDEGKNKKRKKF